MGLGRGGGGGGLEFQQDDIKTRERKRGDRQGHGEPRRETRRTQGGDEKKEQGIRQAAIKRGRGREEERVASG